MDSRSRARCSIRRSDGDDSGLAPVRVRRVVHQSLERLGVERIDVYLIHEPDPATPLAATLSALEELVREGAIGAIGISNVDAAFVAEAVRLAPIAVVQNEYSLLVRDAENDVLPLCAEHGIEFQAFSPLAGGWLTGKYAHGAPYPDGSRMTLRPDPYADFVRPEVFAALDGLGRRGDAAALALAWVLANPLVGAVVVGPRRQEHLDTVWAALELSSRARRADRVVHVEPLNVVDFEELARERLDDMAWEYFRGGAGDETTLRDNRAALERWKLQPRVLVDVSESIRDDGARHAGLGADPGRARRAAEARAPRRRGCDRARGRSSGNDHDSLDVGDDAAGACRCGGPARRAGSRSTSFATAASLRR